MIDDLDKNTLNFSFLTSSFTDLFLTILKSYPTSKPMKFFPLYEGTLNYGCVLGINVVMASLMWKFALKKM